MEGKAFPTLTPREIKLITALIVDGELNIKPDWEKVSKSAGLKNKKAASDSWYLLKKKLSKVSAGGQGAENGDSSKRKTTDDNADEADTEATEKQATKRPRKSTNKAAQKNASIKNEQVDEGV